MDNTKDIASNIFAAIGEIVVFCVIAALPTMWLWNGTLPELFKFPTIDFWMALKISLLAGILFRKSGSSSSSE